MLGVATVDTDPMLAFVMVNPLVDKTLGYEVLVVV
jgi:hypothetical protein